MSLFFMQGMYLATSSVFYSFMHCASLVPHISSINMHSIPATSPARLLSFAPWP